MFCYYTPCATFLNKCCCTAVLQVDLLLKICSTQWTDIFLKYSSSKFPEPSSFFGPSHSAKETILPISSTPPDTNTITTATTTISAKIFWRSCLCLENQASLKHYWFYSIKKKKRQLFWIRVKFIRGVTTEFSVSSQPPDIRGLRDSLSAPYASFHKRKCWSQLNKFMFLLKEELFFPRTPQRASSTFR